MRAIMGPPIATTRMPLDCTFFAHSTVLSALDCTIRTSIALSAPHLTAPCALNCAFRSPQSTALSAFERSFRIRLGSTARCTLDCAFRTRLRLRFPQSTSHSTCALECTFRTQLRFLHSTAHFRSQTALSALKNCTFRSQTAPHSTALSALDCARPPHLTAFSAFDRSFRIRLGSTALCTLDRTFRTRPHFAHWTARPPFAPDCAFRSRPHIPHSTMRTRVCTTFPLSNCIFRSQTALSQSSALSALNCAFCTRLRHSALDGTDCTFRI